MVVHESLKLNRFQHVAIPDNSAFFSRFEGVRPTSASFSGDDDSSPELQSKIDAIAAGKKLVESEQE